ncbi:MAG: sigma-70 family RNA polymerase sigma factor [Gemmatimonadetes bacterium]|nr:sigma-70 family RNA polymerase sigma factor [Gemmatimonadota bacterium]
MDSRHEEPVTRLLERVSQGDAGAATELLPLVYGELRRLAVARMAKVPPGNTLQPTALVHEAYLRLVGKGDPGWNGRGHFFGAAAEAMRQILVDQARRKSAARHGGGRKRLDVDEVEIAFEAPVDDILALNLALEKLEESDPRKAAIVKLRFFAGLDRLETAAALGVSVATVDRDWRYILARLHSELAPDDPEK